MRAHFLGLITAAALALLVSNTSADAITYNFSGAFDAPINALPIGTPFTGTFSYDFPQTGTVFPYRSGTVSLYTYTSLSLTVGGQTVTEPSDVLSLVNDTSFGDQLITGNWYPFGTGVPASSGSLGGITPSHILFLLSEQAFQN
jgi:hypothetical protein